MSKTLKKLREYIESGQYNYTAPTIGKEEVNTCIKALEKQVAKKPRINRVSNDTEYMKCSQCKLTTVLYSDMRPDYCPKCGQKLDYRLE